VNRHHHGEHQQERDDVAQGRLQEVDHRVGLLLWGLA
jgi:hypothetical protein